MMDADSDPISQSGRLTKPEKWCDAVHERSGARARHKPAQALLLETSDRLRDARNKHTRDGAQNN